MLFASLINHLAVQQIREPHGNLISHGKGEEEESSGGKRELLVAGSLYFIPLFSPAEHRARCVGVERKICWFFFFCFYAWALAYPTSTVLSLEHASVPVSL